MIELTSATLTKLGVRIDRAMKFAPHLRLAMAEFEINTPVRQASFLAQVLHESGLLMWLTEIWGPTLAQRHYEGRADLGNVQAGDGFKFRGRGLIQTTGRDNYQRTGDALGVDLIAEPERLAEPEMATRSAAWFWKAHGLNELADGGDIVRMTRRVNCGENGLSERTALYEAAKEVLA
jgi:putative chitinase